MRPQRHGLARGAARVLVSVMASNAARRDDASPTPVLSSVVGCWQPQVLVLRRPLDVVRRGVQIRQRDPASDRSRQHRADHVRAQARQMQQVVCAAGMQTETTSHNVHLVAGREEFLMQRERLPDRSDQVRRGLGSEVRTQPRRQVAAVGCDDRPARGPSSTRAADRDGDTGTRRQLEASSLTAPEIARRSS